MQTYKTSEPAAPSAHSVAIDSNDNFHAFFTLLFREIKQELSAKIAETLLQSISANKIDYCAPETVPEIITKVAYDEESLKKLFIGKVDKFRHEDSLQPDQQLLALSTLLGRAIVGNTPQKAQMSKDYNAKLPNALVFRTLADAFNFVLNESPNNFSFTHAETERSFQILIDSRSGKCVPVEPQMLGSEVIEVAKFRVKTPPTGIKPNAGMLLSGSGNNKSILLSDDEELVQEKINETDNQEQNKSLGAEFDRIQRQFDRELQRKEIEVHQLGKEIREAYYSHEESVKIREMKHKLIELSNSHLKLTSEKREALLQLKYGDLPTPLQNTLLFEELTPMNTTERVKQKNSMLYAEQSVGKQEEHELEPSETVRFSQTLKSEQKSRYSYMQESLPGLINEKKYLTKYLIAQKNQVV